jgi:hypothetical protein
MSLDKIVVIILALLFFGGILIVALRSRRAKGGDQPSSPSPDPRNDESFSQLQPKERRK